MKTTKERIYDYLVAQARDGYSPSMREIGNAVGLTSSATVHKHLQVLEKEGFITSTGKSRGIRVKSGLGIMIVGNIAAGYPITAEEQDLGELDMPASAFAGSGDVVALKIIGNSMIDAHICDGDYAIIRKQPSVENGEIAAVTVDGEGTLKRLITSENGIMLKAENSEFKSISLSRETVDENGMQIEVFGKLVGVVRRLDR